MKKLYYLILSIMAVIGLWSVIIRLGEGMKVTALTTYSSWGLWVVLYIFFIGLSAGSFLLSTMVYVFNMKQFERVGRIALLSALVSLGAGMLFILIDIGHPERFWHTLVYRQGNSVLSWEIHFYLIYLVLMLAELWFLMREDLNKAAGGTGIKAAMSKLLALGYKAPQDAEQLGRHRKSAKKWLKALGIIGIPTAIAVHGGTGSIFGVVTAKHYWNSGLTPIIFLVSALVSGTALMAFIYAFWSPETDDKDTLLKKLGSLLALFISVDLLLVAAEYLIGFYSTSPEARLPLMNIVSGDNWYIFWIGQIALGALIPLALVARRNASRRAIGVAGLSVIIGIVAVRWNLIVPAYDVLPIHGLDKAYFDPRLVNHYVPNTVEWLSSLGLISLAVLIFSVAWEILPVIAEEEVQLSYDGQTNEVSTIKA